VLYAAAPLGILCWAVGVRAGPSPRSRVLAVARTASCALAAPFAYQIFRMGYYAATAPNTAIAKEAFLANWSQGACYFDNFFGTYFMVVPLSAAAIFWLARLHSHAAARRWSPFVATIAPPIAAAAHVVYVVRLGGDYMHARMFVPAVFATLLPVAMVPLSAPPLPWARGVLGLAGVVICGWLPLCGARLRVGVENVCTIGDERGWHARMAKVANPVALESYRNHPFYEASRSALQRLAGLCPGLSPGEAASDPGCRAISLDDDEQAKLAPPCANCRIAGSVPSRVGAALSGGAIGMLGYVLPSSVHVFDRHGLADPLVARAKIQQRARPGHEKTLPPAWMVARLSEPAAVEDASVTAARHALHCGELAALEHAITGPLSVGLFFDNVAHAVRLDRLRIPSDPFEAESEFCGTPPLPHSSTGGGGGTAFQWRCPPGIAVSRVRGTFKDSERVVGTVRAVCGVATSAVIGRAFGEGTDPPFDVACPDDSTAIGLHGRSDNLVRSVGLVCLREGGEFRTGTGGVGSAPPFALICPDGSAVIGIEGRSGAGIDAVGIVCGQP